MKTRRDPATKPYYRCLSCSKFRKECGGMPTRGMDLQEWCEYIRDVKETFRLTNAYIAQQADVSITTVEKIMALSIDRDIMRATARRIEMVVLGAVSQHFCYMDTYTADTIKHLEEEIAYWRKENDRKARIIDKYLDI